MGAHAFGLLGHHAIPKVRRSEGLGPLDQVADAMDGWVFHGVSVVGSFRSGSGIDVCYGMHLVVHEEPGPHEFDKKLLEVIAAVDALYR